MAETHGFKIWNLAQSEFLAANPHVAAVSIGAGALILAAVAYRAVAPALTAKTENDRDFVPPSRLGVQNVFELVGEFLQQQAHEIIGHGYKKFLPLLIFIFIWTLTNNLLGIVPGLGSATDNINTTMAMSLTVFAYYNFQGIRAHGLLEYLRSIAGHLSGLLLLLLGPVMFVIELISHCVRPLTMGIRLRTNIYADHEVYYGITQAVNSLGAYLGVEWGAFGKIFGALLSSLLPVPIVLLGILVCVIQAFVFTVLTTVYIGMATAHDDH
jgi:F-type H+-transporting ATPase subunit a